MKLETERRALLRALNAASSVVERRATIPILQNVHLAADADGLTIKATDLDIETTDRIAAMVYNQGQITVLAQTLHDIVKSLPDGALISIEVGADERMTVKAGRSRFQLATLPAVDFPAMASPQYKTEFSICPASLLRLLDKAKFAMSTEETRYYLQGVYLHLVGTTLRAVATDGHRLAQVDMDAPDGAEDMPGVIVPRKTVAEFVKLLAGAAGDVVLSVSDTKIRITTETGGITSKVIDGTFPDYTRVIPRNNDKRAVMGAGEMRNAVARVLTVAAERVSAVKLQFAQDAVTLTAAGASQEGRDEIGAGYDADPFDIGVNGKYLVEILSQVEGSAVFQMGSAGDPIIVRDDGDADMLMIVMPMRVM